MDITRDNYKIIAARVYRNPVFSDDEFETDLALLRRVVKKIEKFCETGQFNTRLVFNNFVVACNCFSIGYVVRVLFLLSDPKYHSAIFTFVDGTVGMSNDLKINDALRVDVGSFIADAGMHNKLCEDLGDVYEYYKSR